ncbi:maleylpyruvate isomerase family mycothiol-dependent enzyme [Vallicoccus soli]|uniref:Maleylpyruvate isomerase family mycothiol-dependent enzyme n=1 Tax=Vallicoccus soli TaxID=2339232 RepID=A0A3A3Z315_9ACTN|nr:maleylpyruvate isomerase family mycothiol-dependent enzyme [Vallicoccus soli]RJK97802.1 maleylpyruvate isomerase family mycothiol-dependent enzyme [Vallicoccus soli]
MTVPPAPDAPSTRLAPERYLALLRADAARAAALAVPGALDGPVPHCPGWSVRDVLVHTGRVYLDKAAVLRTGAPAGEPDERPGDDEVVPWFLGALGTVVGELERRDPAAPAWSWWPQEPTVGFWYRRMAQETAVHRVDVEGAVDALTPVAADLAVDGVDEVLTRFLVDPRTPAPEGVEPGIIAVRTAGRTWRVALDADGVQVAHGPGSSDATVTGDPSELLLWLWRRRGEEAVDASGEAGVVAALRTWMGAATQ